MREPLSALTRADIVVIHHADLACEAQLETIARTVQDSGTTCSVFFSKLAPSHIFEVHQPLQKISLNVLGGMIVLCVSAIGCPDAFIHTVREISGIISTLSTLRSFFQLMPTVIEHGALLEMMTLHPF